MSEPIPTFKFELERSQGKVIEGSYGKEATVEQLPISKWIAGVSMKLEPGAMRELHWHATAAEWAFVIEGRTRTTVIDPQGNSETNDFEPGDVWYFPRGHGHQLECLGNKPKQFILIFDNGDFSEFGTFSITDWNGHTPKPLLAKNFGVPESTFDGFPEKEVYFARGSLPPEKPATPLQGQKLPPQTHKWRLLAQAPIIDNKGGRLWLVDSKKWNTDDAITYRISATVPVPCPLPRRQIHYRVLRGHPCGEASNVVAELPATSITSPRHPVQGPIMGSIAAPDIPEVGQAVRVRNRLATVRAVEPYDSRSAQGRLHIVDLEYLDDWRYPESEQLLWEVEGTAKVLGAASLPGVDANRPDSPGACRRSSTPIAGPA